MADDFETDLEGLFDRAPAFEPEALNDAAFARAVDARVGRLIRMRRMVYGSAATVGALLAMSQLPRLADLTWTATVAATEGLNQAAGAVDPQAWIWAAAISLLGLYVVHVLREA